MPDNDTRRNEAEEAAQHAEYRKHSDLVRAQLEYVEANLNHYLHNDTVGPRGETHMMPHEWGSMDTLDDMRNSLDVAAALMCDVDVGYLPDDTLRKLADEYPPEAFADEVFKAIVAGGLDKKED